jgi:hypothetical protein
MPNVITSTRTYASYDRAEIRLGNVLHAAGMSLAKERWLIAATEDGRFVPTLVGEKYIPFAHVGIMVIG